MMRAVAAAVLFRFHHGAELSIVTSGNGPPDSPGPDRRLSSARWVAGVSVSGDSA